jgi:hypothetical protein
VGKKINKANGCLVKKFTDQVKFLHEVRENTFVMPMQGFDYATICNLYVTSTGYSIRIEAALSFHDSDHTCCYEKGCIYLGDISGQDLTVVSSFTPLELLSYDDQWSRYNSAAEAKDTLEKATNAMHHDLRSFLH